MRRSLAPIAAAATAIAHVAAKGCVVFDQNNNLLVLGPQKDYTLGTQDTWGSGGW